METPSGKAPPLLPVPDGLTRPNDRLCDSCAQLNITPRDFIVSLDRGEDDSTEQKNKYMTSGAFGLVREIKAKSTSCPMCRIFLHSLGTKDIPDEEDGVPTEVTYAWDQEAQVPDSDDSEDDVPHVRWLGSSVRRQGGAYCSATFLTPPFARIGLLANDVPTRNKSLLPRIIGDQIDFSMVRGWIERCEALHGDQCWGPHPDLEHHGADILDELPSFQVIDVIDKCLTRAPRKCKYVALSYVWGPIDPLSILRTLKSNVSDLRKPGSLSRPELSHKIPLTVRDAMHVVEQLHMRYLWVDSLCIIQDDDGEGGTKMQSIASMAPIYGAAALVMVVACGADAHSGLPGLHTGTKRQQPIEEISPGFRLAFRQLYQYTLTDSVYYSRGWTYQEFYLARRKLLFLDGQVVYTCEVIEQFREDVVCEGTYAQPNSKDATPNFHNGDDIGIVETPLSEYSKRSITYDTDVYHALSAMNFVIRRSIGANLCHGNPDTFFDWFLLWAPDERQSRRKVTPSWSWSGWLGQSGTDIWDAYTRSIVRLRKIQPKRTWIIWYQRTAHDSHDCIRVDKARTKKQDSASTKRMQERLSFDCTRTDPTPRKLIEAPIYIYDTYHPHPGSGFLQFWTISAQFNLDSLTTELTGFDQLRKKGDGFQYAGIFGNSGRELGVIMLDPVWFKANVPGRHEFIILCECRVERPESYKALDKEAGWKYGVMIIEWKGNGQWAERVAVGAIEINDLDEAMGDAIWKEIILG